MEYRIVSDSSYRDFVEEVNRLMQQGWEPAGGVAISPYQPRLGGSYSDEIIYHQAMVLRGRR